MTLQALRTSEKATGILSGRLLVQSSSRWSDRALEVSRAPMSGLVLTGTDSATQLAKIRRAWPDLIIAHDPESYREINATGDAPFLLPTAGLFGPVDLDETLDQQRVMGASFAVTPTGHLAFEDSLSLKAAVVKSAELTRTDTVVHFPLDARWLKPSHIAEVIEAIRNSPHPVGISLAHNQDPLTIAGVAEGLQRIARLDEPVILFRTDLAGLDFLARGGMAATVGATSTLRHGIAPHMRGRKINVADQRTNLLWRPLLHYIRPSYLEDLHANAPQPTCNCGACCGRTLNRFDTSTAGQKEAKVHNLVALREVFDLFRSESGGRRRAVWRAEARSAIAEHERTAIALSQRSFRAPTPLTHWAF